MTDSERDPLKDYDLVKRASIAEMVETYIRETEVVKRAYALLWQSKQNLERVFGEEFADFDTFPDRVHQSEDTYEAIINKMKCNAWEAIVNRLKLHKLLSPTRWDELQRKLEDHRQMPEINMKNVADMLTAYQQNAQTFLEESIKEVYDYLRPRSEYKGAEYKTNQRNARFELGRKIILTRMVDTSFGTWRVHYGRTEQELVSLDMVFTHLDGEMVPDGYRSPLVDAINTTEAESGRPVETKYFRVKAYKNGNLHLEFLRVELLAKFNAVAGGKNLKPNH